jgi:hypothetical protein
MLSMCDVVIPERLLNANGEGVLSKTHTHTRLTSPASCLIGPECPAFERNVVDESFFDH